MDGVVWPLHYADIRLKHPEKRFRVGASIRTRVWNLEPERNRVVLTLKRSLLESTHSTPMNIDEVAVGTVISGVVSKIMEKGCLVDLWGGLRAFVPRSEARWVN